MNIDFSDVTVLLVGDFMLDHYIMGTSNRMSPEAPVPVVVPKKEYSIPGGAGNVAMNLCAMGANVTCLGKVGDDIWGEKLLSIMKNNDINIDGIDIIKNHPTTLKQRIYSDGNQVARLDTEKFLDWSPTTLSKKLIQLQRNKSYDVCIFSDYNKGVISKLPSSSIINTDFVIVDPKKNDFSLYSNTNIITPNINELQKTTNTIIKDDESIIDICNNLIKQYNFDYIVAKKGNQGMTIVGDNNFVKHIKAYLIDNPDVTGAGDTVISALSIAYAKTKDIEKSSIIANAAAAIAVSKKGTATVTIDEINNYIVTNT